MEQREVKITLKPSIQLLCTAGRMMSQIHRSVPTAHSTLPNLCGSPEFNKTLLEVRVS